MTLSSSDQSSASVGATRDRADIIVIGGGIAGAGVAWFLAQAGADVLVLEAEDSCAYHTTGRSAAFYAETYGGRYVQPLSTASKGFLTRPPADFSPHGFLTPRGALHVFTHDQRALADAMAGDMRAVDRVEIISAHNGAAIAPHLRWHKLAGGVYDPDCADIDVAGLHQGYLAGLKRAGGHIQLDCRIESADRQGGCWHLRDSKDRSFKAATVVLAGGAWSDALADIFATRRPNITPMRRSIAVTEALPVPVSPSTILPLVLDIAESVYFRPEGQGFLVSPADETPCVPADCRPEEEDIALGLARFEALTGLEPKRLVSTWAGQRSFTADRMPLIGPAGDQPGLFWSAGQGGWGIQTSPAWSALLAERITGEALAARFGIDLSAVDPDLYDPGRLYKAA